MALDRPTTLRLHVHSPALGGQDLFFEDDPDAVRPVLWRPCPVVLPPPLVPPPPDRVADVIQPLMLMQLQLAEIQTTLALIVALMPPPPQPSWWSRMIQWLREQFRS